MSKDSHSFSVSVACEVGVPGAILIQHILFIQKSNISPGENWQEKWVKRTAVSIAKTYPYWSAKQVSTICDSLEKGSYIVSRISNALKTDRAKSYILTAKGLHLMGEIPFYQMENGFSEKANAATQKENPICQNGEMLIKVDCNSFVPSFVKGSAGANAPLVPPLKKVGEIEIPETLEAEKEKPIPPVAPAPPPQNGATRVKLYDPQLPGVTLVDSVPIQPQTPPENTGREQATRDKKENEIALASRMIAYLNEKAGRDFRVNGNSNAKHIISRARDGFSEEDMRMVVDSKVREWGGDARFCRYLRPETLFCNLHFESYLQEAKHIKPMPAPTQQNGKGGSLTRAGGDLSKYEGKQLF